MQIQFTCAPMAAILLLREPPIDAASIDEA
jgi:hypothetical protein